MNSVHNQDQGSTLLVFAHRGEAQVFLRELELTRIADSGLPFNVYSSSDNRCFAVVTGEGMQNASECASATLARFGHGITRVINLGIAGILGGELSVGQNILIRTCYAQKNIKDMEFKSFSTTNISETTVVCDLVSARDRVLEPAVAQHLACFAPIVDREAWAVGSVAARFQKPFYCLKHLSDRAGDQAICHVAKSESYKYSQQLFHSYQQTFLNQKKPSPVTRPLPEGFYFTKAQSDLFLSLLHRMSLKSELSPEELWEVLAEESKVKKLVQGGVHPKVKTQQLIKFMTARLNPFYSKLEAKILNVLQPLSAEGIGVEFNEDMAETKLSATVRNKNDFEKMTASLQSFDYQRLQDLLEGKSP